MANYQIRRFKADVHKWIEAAGKDVEQVATLLLKDIHAALVHMSPVDTGRFRGNWQVTVNHPAMHSLNEYDKGGQRTIKNGDSVIDSIFRNGAAVTSVHFSNMLIYANALEYGHSKQAPAGIVGIVSIKARSFAANAVMRVRGGNL